MVPLPIPLFPCHYHTVATPLILPPSEVQVCTPGVQTAPHSLLTYTVKVSLLVPGTGNEVAGLHAGLDGRGSLLQAATPLRALP